jgi:hypothetical protein
MSYQVVRLRKRGFSGKRKLGRMDATSKGVTLIPRLLLCVSWIIILLKGDRNSFDNKEEGKIYRRSRGAQYQ